MTSAGMAERGLSLARAVELLGSVSLGACLVLASGCEGEAQHEVAGALPEEQFADALASAHCDELEHCCIAEGNAYDRDRCRQYVEAGLGYNVPADRRNRFSYDAEAAAQCVAATREAARSCKAPEAMEACYRVFTGTTPAGEPCEFFNECARPPEGSAICDTIESKVCLARFRGRAGDPCADTCTESEAGPTSCTGTTRQSETTIAQCWTNDGLYCSIGRCQPLLALGEICDNDLECGPTGYCDRICKSALTEGQACIGFFSCEAPLYCHQETGVCRRPKPPGAACDYIDSDECRPGFCNKGVCVTGYPFADEDLCAGGA